MEKQLFIKGFDKDLKCRDYQFEVGKVYDTGFGDDDLKICTEKVFHFCRNLKQVHKHYSCNGKYENRFCYIEVLGGMVEEDDKCGSNKIKIVRELTKEEFEKETITMADINRSRIVINKKLLKLELNFNHYISKGNKEE